MHIWVKIMKENKSFTASRRDAVAKEVNVNTLRVNDLGST